MFKAFLVKISVFIIIDINNFRAIVIKTFHLLLNLGRAAANNYFHY